MLERIKLILAGGVFLLLPFVVWPYFPNQEYQLTTAKYIACFILGNFFFSLYLAKKIHWTLFPVHLLISVQSALYTLPPLLLENKSTGDIFVDFNHDAIYSYVYWTGAVFSALFFLDLADKWKRALLLGLMYGGVFSCFMAVFQILDLDFVFQYAPNIEPHDRILPIAFFGQTTKFGAFLALSLGIALSFRRYPEALILLFTGIFTNSSMTFLSLIAALLVGLKERVGRDVTRAIILLGLGGALIAYLIKPDAGIFWSNGRWPIWEATLTAWIENRFFFGFGPGSFMAIFAKVFQPDKIKYGEFIWAHNDYFQVLFEYGLVGGLVLLLVLFFLLRHYFKYWWEYDFLYRERGESLKACEALLATLLVNAFGNFPFQLQPHFMIGVISICMILRYNKETGNTRSVLDGR